MSNANETEGEQTRLWNGVAGRAWVDAQDLIDRVLKPFEDLLLAEVPAGSGWQVLDVGCGTGATTVAIARRVGAEGGCVGIDISEPMLAAARVRAEREGAAARFVSADAESHAFERSSFDAVVSRFGVMFFGDPVRAFANLRRATKTGAELWFVVWRGAAENPFMTAAERAAAPLLPNLPARRPDAPGQFALADREKVFRILEASGWAEIEIRPIDVACSLPEVELMGYATRLGPLGQVLHEADEPTRARVVDAVRAGFEPFVQGAEVRFTAACWLARARAPEASAPPDETAHA